MSGRPRPGAGREVSAHSPRSRRRSLWTAALRRPSCRSLLRRAPRRVACGGSLHWGRLPVELG
eukprot:3799303-Heterocapsa_arctica.AAC.1